jgi:hypothetical protein
MMYLLIEKYNPEVHTGHDNIIGVFKTRVDAEEMIEFYCYDTELNEDNYEIVEIPVLTAQPPL